MSRGVRIVLIAAAILVSASVLTAAAGAVYLYRDGMIDVHVQEKAEDGSNIHVMAPTSLVRLVLAFVPLPDDMRPPEEAAQWWPLLEAACAGISRAPDGVLVEVESKDEHVVITKQGGRLTVDVDDHDVRVHVSVPLRAVELVVRRMRPSNHGGWGPRATITITGLSTPWPGAPRA